MKLFENSNKRRLTEGVASKDAIDQSRKEWIGEMVTKRKIIEQKLKEVDNITVVMRTFVTNVGYQMKSIGVVENTTSITNTAGLDKVTMRCFYETSDKSDTTPEMIKSLENIVEKNMPRGFRLDKDLNGKYNKNGFVVSVVYDWGNSYF